MQNFNQLFAATGADNRNSSTIPPILSLNQQFRSMKNFKNLFSSITLLSLLLFGMSGISQVSTWTTPVSGAWLTPGNWSPAGAPSGITAEAYININTQPTMGINMNTILLTNSSIGAIHFDAPATTNRTIQNSSGTAGTFTLNGLTVNSVNNVILRNNSSATLTVQNGSSIFNLGLGNIVENVISIDGTGGIVISSAITGSGRNLVKTGTGSGVLELTNANTYSGLTSVTGGTLRLNRAGGNTIPSTNNVEVTGGTLQVNTSQTLNNLTVGPGGNINVASGVNLIINGVLSVSSTTSFGLGNIIINGTLKIEEGGYPGTTGNWSFGPGSGTLEFSNTSGLYGVNNEVWWPASDMSRPYNLYVTGSGGIQMNVNRTISGYFATNAQVTGSALTFEGFAEISSGGYFSTAPNYTSGSTLFYNTGGTFGRSLEWSDISNPGYPHHVRINGSTTLDLGNGGTGVLRACAGNLTILGGSALYMDFGANDMTQPLIVNGNLDLFGTLSLSDALGGDLKLRGDFNHSGTLNPKDRAVFFDGTADQTISGQPINLDFVVVDKASGDLILGDNLICNKTLTLSNGKINTNSYQVEVTCTGNINRTNGWVNGDLKVCIPTGATALTLAVGDATVYGGVDVSFGNVTSSGDLTATSAENGGAPAIGATPGGSGLSQTKYVDRKWTVTNTGVTFDNYSATFHFAPGDIAGGGNTNNFIVGKKDGGTWSAPVVGARTATSTQITGATTFSEFSVAEACVPPSIASISAAANPICGDATTTLSAIDVMGDGASVTWWTATGGTGTQVGSGMTSNPVGPGTYYAYVTGDCGTAEANVTVGAKVDVAITSATAAASPICATETTTLTANGVVGTNAVVNWWTGTGGTGANLGTGMTLMAGTGTYYAYVTGDCGTAEANVTVGSKVDVAITSATAAASPICASATTTLTANGVVGTNNLITWWSGQGGTGSNLGTGMTLMAGPGTYYAYVTGDCGSPAEASVTVGAKVDVGITSATAASSPICASATATLTANGVVGTNAVVNWWTGSGGTGTNLGSGLTLVAGPGTYYAYVTGDCGTDEESVTVGAIPNAAVSGVSGTSPLCTGATETYTASDVVLSGGTGAWSSTNGLVATVNSTTGEVTAVGLGTCDIIFTITGGCGGTASAMQSLTVITAPSALSYTPSTNTYAEGTAITPLSPSVSGTSPFTYTVSSLPVGLSIDPASGVISGTPTAPTATHTYMVTATNACGATSTTLTFTINAIPFAGGGCSLLDNNFSTNPQLANTNVNGAWYPDRYRPAGFTSNGSQLKISINAADGAQLRPSAFSGVFYNTQGRKINQCGGCVTVAKADLYIPADWATEKRRSDLWVTSFNSSNAVLPFYPIIGFRNTSGSNPQMSVWTGSAWNELGAPSLGYNTSYTLEFRINGANLEYLINSVVVATYASGGMAYFGDVMLN